MMSGRILVTGLGLALFLAGQAKAYEAVAVTDGGTLTGTVKYTGAAPAPEKFEVTKDVEVCGKEKTKDDLVVSSGGAVSIDWNPDRPTGDRRRSTEVLGRLQDHGGQSAKRGRQGRSHAGGTRTNHDHVISVIQGNTHDESPFKISKSR